MIVWLFGIAVGGIVIFLVAQKSIIKRWPFSLEFERKVDKKIQEMNNQLQKELKQIESSNEEKIKEIELKIQEMKCNVELEKEFTYQQKWNVLVAGNNTEIENVKQKWKDNIARAWNNTKISWVDQWI